MLHKSLLTAASLLLAVTLILPGCGESPSDRGGTNAAAAAVSTSGNPSPSTKERIVNTGMGEVKVPSEPRSVAVLVGPFNDHLLALGVKPTAADSGDKNRFPSYLASRLEGVQQLGNTWTPNLEAILQAQPDLILSQKGVHEKAYGDLTRIAPTILFDEPTKDWRKTLLEIGEIVGKKETAETRLAEFDRKASETKEKLKGRSGETFMFLRVMPKEIRVYDKKKPVVELMIRQLGLTPAAGIPDEQALAVTMEKLPELNPDHIYLLNESEERLKEFQDNPLWKNLTAVRKGQIHPVTQEIWVAGAGPLALEQAMDDIAKALVK